MSGFLTAEQMRAARAMLRWEQDELAEKARVSVKTIKRMESTTGRMESRSDYAVKKALEMAGIEFLDGDDRKRRGEGVRFQADRTEKLRETIVANITTHFPGTLKYAVDEDPELFDRPTDEVVEVVMTKLGEELRSELRSTLNKREPTTL
ncbi:hypothetical protein [Rhodopseudomonas sp. P2A-2r]|uniref:helix-turn-helix domain-containing protein n=1 Tax=Rhodopseudomonas sp. P2A-2r TaxID=2991972 RepID=UPI0029FF1AD3|nr:hypothetical protein [Rhodopseudomonas sp. P2A-2r]